MKKTFITPQGSETRTLTDEEIEFHASQGDYTAKRVVLNKEDSAASLDPDSLKKLEKKVEAILKFLK